VRDGHAGRSASSRSTHDRPSMKLPIVSQQKHERKFHDGRVRKPKPQQVGVQISCCVHSQVPLKDPVWETGGPEFESRRSDQINQRLSDTLAAPNRSHNWLGADLGHNELRDDCPQFTGRKQYPAGCVAGRVVACEDFLYYYYISSQTPEVSATRTVPLVRYAF
jgi:hypothetical protein